MDIGDKYTYDIRIEDGTTSYKPAGRNATDAEGKRLQIAAKFEARAQSESVGLIVIDPVEAAEPGKKRLRLEDSFDDYIEDAFKRNALEAREQAMLVKAEFLNRVPITYADEVTRDRILDFDTGLRDQGRSSRTIANKRQRLQSMLRWAGVDAKIFPPKPKYDKKLPTIYTPEQLAGLFRSATPYEAMVSNLALKLGLRDQEVQFSEFPTLVG
jgi:integrase